MERHWTGITSLFIASAALLQPANALAQNNNFWGVPPQAPSPWGGGGGSVWPGYGAQANPSLSFPTQGVICDRSVSVCFNASGADLRETERLFGQQARLRVENGLRMSPIIDVTFADGRYCNFSLRGCWTNRQRTTVDTQLNPWVFGSNPYGGNPYGGNPGQQGAVIGGPGGPWGAGNGMDPSNTFQAQYTRTRQSGSCSWMEGTSTIYNGNCRYEILQDNFKRSRNLTFTFDNQPNSSPNRKLQFKASRRNPWTIQMANGLTAPVQSSIDAGQSQTRITMDWNNGSRLRFRSTNQATRVQLNEAKQVVDAYGRVQPSNNEALGRVLGGLLQQVFGGF